MTHRATAQRAPPTPGRASQGRPAPTRARASSPYVESGCGRRLRLRRFDAHGRLVRGVLLVEDPVSRDTVCALDTVVIQQDVCVDVATSLGHGEPAGLRSESVSLRQTFRGTG